MEGYERYMRSDKIGARGGANERNLFARDTVGSVALCNRLRAPVRAPVYKKYFPCYFCGWKCIVTVCSINGEIYNVRRLARHRRVDFFLNN